VARKRLIDLSDAPVPTNTKSRPLVRPPRLTAALERRLEVADRFVCRVVGEVQPASARSTPARRYSSGSTVTRFAPPPGIDEQAAAPLAGWPSRRAAPARGRALRAPRCGGNLDGVVKSDDRISNAAAGAVPLAERRRGKCLDPLRAIDLADAIACVALLPRLRGRQCAGRRSP